MIIKKKTSKWKRVAETHESIPPKFKLFKTKKNRKFVTSKNVWNDYTLFCGAI